MKKKKVCLSRSFEKGVYTSYSSRKRPTLWENGRKFSMLVRENTKSVYESLSTRSLYLLFSHFLVISLLDTPPTNIYIRSTFSASWFSSFSLSVWMPHRIFSRFCGALITIAASFLFSKRIGTVLLSFFCSYSSTNMCFLPDDNYHSMYTLLYDFSFCHFLFFTFYPSLERLS